ncbi:MAG: DNA polymerase III subunit delta' [Solirubrobacteraceae bacterium]
MSALEHHPHALAVLGPVMDGRAQASHAYLFQGPPGSGKAAAARSLAVVLLTEGAQDPVEAGERVRRGAHPDLGWVTPSGAAEMLVSDIDEPVVLAATRTPFESRRRVFVIEEADTLNDAAANRMLKTLEEPADFAHLILLSARPQELLETIASRCLRVRFDALPAIALAAQLEHEGAAGPAADACARLSLGDGRLARALLDGELRGAAEALARRCDWAPLLAQAKAGGERAAALEQAELQRRLQITAKSDRRRVERESAERSRRAVRRAGMQTLDRGLALAGLWFRDAGCIADGAPELVHATDRARELAADAAGRTAHGLRRALEAVEETRLSLALNVAEELALEALAYRLAEPA